MLKNLIDASGSPAALGANSATSSDDTDDDSRSSTLSSSRGLNPSSCGSTSGIPSSSNCAPSSSSGSRSVEDTSYSCLLDLLSGYEGQDISPEHSFQLTTHGGEINEEALQIVVNVMSRMKVSEQGDFAKQALRRMLIPAETTGGDEMESRMRPTMEAVRVGDEREGTSDMPVGVAPAEHTEAQLVALADLLTAVYNIIPHANIKTMLEELLAERRKRAAFNQAEYGVEEANIREYVLQSQKMKIVLPFMQCVTTQILAHAQSALDNVGGINENGEETANNQPQVDLKSFQQPTSSRSFNNQPQVVTLHEKKDPPTTSTRSLGRRIADETKTPSTPEQLANMDALIDAVARGKNPSEAEKAKEVPMRRKKQVPTSTVAESANGQEKQPSSSTTLIDQADALKEVKTEEPAEKERPPISSQRLHESPLQAAQKPKCSKRPASEAPATEQVRSARELVQKTSASSNLFIQAPDALEQEAARGLRKLLRVVRQAPPNAVVVNADEGRDVSNAVDSAVAGAPVASEERDDANRYQQFNQHLDMDMDDYDYGAVVVGVANAIQNHNHFDIDDDLREGPLLGMDNVNQNQNHPNDVDMEEAARDEEDEVNNGVIDDAPIAGLQNSGEDAAHDAVEPTAHQQRRLRPRTCKQKDQTVKQQKIIAYVKKATKKVPTPIVRPNTMEPWFCTICRKTTQDECFECPLQCGKWFHYHCAGYVNAEEIVDNPHKYLCVDCRKTDDFWFCKLCQRWSLDECFGCPEKKCKRWFHYKCAGFKNEAHFVKWEKKGNRYKCEECRGGRFVQVVQNANQPAADPTTQNPPEKRTVWHCPVCTEEVDGASVGCDGMCNGKKCDEWTHWKCAGISTIKEVPRPYFCCPGHKDKSWNGVKTTYPYANLPSNKSKAKKAKPAARKAKKATKPAAKKPQRTKPAATKVPKVAQPAPRNSSRYPSRR